MFRGGSTSNEGIMSYAQPRKGYADGPDEGGVQDFDLSNYPYGQDNEGDDYTALASKSEDSQINPELIKNEVNAIKDNKKTYKALGQDIEEGSYGDALLKEYLGNRSDPMGKFLINFGLNYMSARPRGGKFGAFATAADAAKKPTEQLFADQDTDRLLKLKLMGSLSKSDGKGAFEKKVDTIWKSEQNKPEGQRRFNSRQEVVDTVTDFERYSKEESPSVKIEKRTNEILKEPGGAPNRRVAKNKAEFELYSLDRLPKTEQEKINFKGQIFIETGDLIKKPNSEDFMLEKTTENNLKQFKTNRNYVDPSTRTVYTYLGPNTFRFVQKY
jgi:hypothetical protein